MPVAGANDKIYMDVSAGMHSNQQNVKANWKGSDEMDHNLYDIPREKLLDASRIPLLVANSAGEIHYEYAIQMIAEIVKNNAADRKTVFILPCGPVEQYPIFARLVNRYRINLKDTWIINMDEYVENGEWKDDKFSFRRVMNAVLYDRIEPELNVPEKQRIFPDPHCPEEIGSLIETLGGVDMAMGGIALNGHIAFNEPQPDLSVEAFAQLPTRVVNLSTETRVKDAILSRGGAIDSVPGQAVTVGMKELLGARKVRFSMLLDMQRAVIRQACLGEVSAACPISLMQNHPDALLMITSNVMEKPF